MKTTQAKLPKIAFGRLSNPPASGTIQFYDGYVAALEAATYALDLTHELFDSSGALKASYTLQRTFKINSPEFAMDPGIVQSAYPPNNSSGIYDNQMPYIVLSDPALPWARSLVPESSSHEPPWLALLIFAEEEIYLLPGSEATTLTSTVQELLNSGSTGTILPPQLKGPFPQEVLSSSSQSITIPGAVFNALMPSKEDLPYLAHCRSVNIANEDDGQGVLLSVVLGNRLPVTTNGSATKFYAHLVSLEGFADYLGPNATPIPTKPKSSELMDVRLVSLYSWTFSSLPQPEESFDYFITNLIQTEQTLSLKLPPEGASPPKFVTDRINQGYVPLSFMTGSGEESFCWYRGPLSPVVPEPLPNVDSGFTPSGPDTFIPVINATSADSLMIYLAEQGVFDLSYATAWNLGRSLALADAHFAQQVNQYRMNSNNALATLSQRMAMPHLAQVDLPALLSRNTSRNQFAKQIGEGLAQKWTAALSQSRLGAETLPTGARRLKRSRHAKPFSPKNLLKRSDIVVALTEHLSEGIDPIASWLAKLSLLYPVPFSYLIPNPDLLPAESIRFFYIDAGWIDALQAGAMSIAFHHSLDVTLYTALRPAFEAAVTKHRKQSIYRAGASHTTKSSIMTGVLINSQLVADLPTLAISATIAGKPVGIVRDDLLSPTVRLCLFDPAAVPDTVTLAEPYRELQFGFQFAAQNQLKIYLRTVTPGGNIGQLTGASFSVDSTYFRTPTTSGVIQIAQLASALDKQLQSNNFRAGDFAIQVVNVPEKQSFK